MIHERERDQRHDPLTAPSALSYASPQSFRRGQPIAPLDPTVTGTVSAYSVTPALPAKLDLNTASKRISGTPSVATVEAAYTVAAQNATAQNATAHGRHGARAELEFAVLLRFRDPHSAFPKHWNGGFNREVRKVREDRDVDLYQSLASFANSAVQTLVVRPAYGWRQ